MKFVTSAILSVALMPGDSQAKNHFIRGLSTCGDPEDYGAFQPVLRVEEADKADLNDDAYDSVFSNADPFPLYRSGQDISKTAFCDARLLNICDGGCGTDKTLVQVQVRCAEQYPFMNDGDSNYFVKVEGVNGNAVDGSADNSGTFEYISVDGIDGFEAEFCMEANAAKKIQVHANVDDNGSNTASTGKGLLEVTIFPHCASCTSSTDCSPSLDACVPTGCVETKCVEGRCVQDAAPCGCSAPSDCVGNPICFDWDCVANECVPTNEVGDCCVFDDDCAGGETCGSDNRCGGGPGIGGSCDPENCQALFGVPNVCNKWGCVGDACVEMPDGDQNGDSCGSADADNCAATPMCSDGSCVPSPLTGGETCTPALGGSQDDACVAGGSCGAGGVCSPNFVSGGGCSSNMPDDADSCYVGNSCGADGMCMANFKNDGDGCTDPAYPSGTLSDDEVCFDAVCRGSGTMACEAEVKIPLPTCTLSSPSESVCYKQTAQCSTSGKCEQDVQPRETDCTDEITVPAGGDPQCYSGTCDGNGNCELLLLENMGCTLEDTPENQCYAAGKCAPAGGILTCMPDVPKSFGEICDLPSPPIGNTCYAGSDVCDGSGACAATYKDANDKCENPPNPNDDCYRSMGQCVGGVATTSVKTCEPVPKTAKVFPIDFDTEMQDCRLADRCLPEDATNPDSPFVRTAQYKDASVVCRAAIPGGCDLEETCTGKDASCPSDAVADAGTVCRPKADNVCDKGAETCDGASPLCPDDELYTVGYSMKCATQQYFCGVTDEAITSNRRGNGFIYTVGSGDYTCNVGTGRAAARPDTCDPEAIGPGGKCDNGRGLSNYAVMECIPELNDWVCCGKCEDVEGVWSCEESGYEGCSSVLPDGGSRFLGGK